MHTNVSSVQDYGNRKTWPNDVVYVGMPCNASRAFGIPDEEGLFGKPWALKNDPRGWAAAYSDMMAARLLVDAEFAARVRQLHNFTLLCYCTAKSRREGVELACHARILAEYVELLYHAKR